MGTVAPADGAVIARRTHVAAVLLGCPVGKWPPRRHAEPGVLRPALPGTTCGSGDASRDSGKILERSLIHDVRVWVKRHNQRGVQRNIAILCSCHASRSRRKRRGLWYG